MLIKQSILLAYFVFLSILMIYVCVELPIKLNAGNDPFSNTSNMPNKRPIAPPIFETKF